jgi:glutamyl-tRNA synthetase
LSRLRESGADARKLIGLLAWSCGLLDTPAPITPNDLLSDFNLADISRTPFVFTESHWKSLESS